MTQANDPNEMEMPCRCDCGNWFDLNDGNQSNHSKNLICDDCAEKEEEEQDKQNKIIDLEMQLSDAMFDVREYGKQLFELDPEHKLIKEWLAFKHPFERTTPS